MSVPGASTATAATLRARTAAPTVPPPAPAIPRLAWPGVAAGSAGVSTLLLLLANGGALVLGGLLHRVALEETGDEALARRAAWLVALMPPAFVMAMGYAEPLAVSLAVV